jgi:FtsH-binding integral membrane protein
MDEFDRPSINAGHVMFGTLLMFLGSIFLLDRLHIVAPWVFGLWFPLFLVLFGLSRIVWPSRPGRQTGGVWIALVGGVLLLDQLDILKVRESWPVFVIVAGLMMTFRAVGWLPSRHDLIAERRYWREARR